MTEAADYGLPQMTYPELVDLFAMIKGDPGKFGVLGLSFTGNPSNGAKGLRDAARFIIENRRNIVVIEEPKEIT